MICSLCNSDNFSVRCESGKKPYHRCEDCFTELLPVSCEEPEAGGDRKLNFTLSKKQLENLDRWIETLKYVLDVTEKHLPGTLSYTFTTSCGISIDSVVVTYEHNNNNYIFKKDLTNGDNY